MKLIRKIWMLIALFILCNLSLYSQWGIKGGVNYSTITDVNYSKYIWLGHIGGTYEIRLAKQWFVQPELLFTSVGSNYKDDGSVLKGGHVKIYALELPINMSFRPSIASETKLIVDFGLYARCGLFGNKTYKYYVDPKVDESPFDAYNRLDMGLNLGLGIQKNHYYGLFSYQRGFTNAMKYIDTNHQVFRLSVGYRFN